MSDEGDGGGGDTSANLIEENPDNNGIAITVGSKNFDEQFILGEIYAQGLEAAGYDVSTDLNLGDETIAFKALEDGEIYALSGVHLDDPDLDLRGPARGRARPTRRPAYDDAQADLEQRRPGGVSRRPRSRARTRSGC